MYAMTFCTHVSGPASCAWCCAARPSGRQARSLKMQATAALVEAGPERETVPVEWLPDEVLELLFRFADPKALLMVVPAVSARGGRQRGDAQLSARGCAWGRRPLQECGWLAGGTFV